MNTTPTVPVHYEGCTYQLPANLSDAEILSVLRLGSRTHAVVRHPGKVVVTAKVGTKG